MTKSHASLRHANSEKARHLLRRGGYKVGGHVKSDEAEDKAMVKKAVHKHEKHDHPGEKLTKLKDGGEALGSKAHARPDRKARASGGKAGKKKGTQVNVIVAGGHGDQPPPRPMPVPVPMGAGAPPPHPMPPAPPPGGMPGAGMPPPGMPPRPMAKKGGRIEKAAGGDATANQRLKEGVARMFARPSPATPSGESSDSNPSWRTVTPADRVTPDEDAALKVSHPDQGPGEYDGQNRGGAQKRKHKAKGGGLTSAGPLNYDGPKKKGNSVPSWDKNDGSSNEGGNRKKRAEGGALPMSHGAGGGLGRLDKAKRYRSSGDHN